jgi:hypothetical protein
MNDASFRSLSSLARFDVQRSMLQARYLLGVSVSITDRSNGK